MVFKLKHSENLFCSTSCRQHRSVFLDFLSDRDQSWAKKAQSWTPTVHKGPPKTPRDLCPTLIMIHDKQREFEKVLKIEKSIKLKSFLIVIYWKSLTKNCLKCWTSKLLDTFFDLRQCLKLVHFSKIKVLYSFKFTFELDFFLILVLRFPNHFCFKNLQNL